MQIKAVRRIGSVLGPVLCTLAAAAQETAEEIKMDKEDHHMWYTSPWVWIIGAIVFILLLLVLLRATERKG